MSSVSILQQACVFIPLLCVRHLVLSRVPHRASLRLSDALCLRARCIVSGVICSGHREMETLQWQDLDDSHSLWVTSFELVLGHSTDAPLYFMLLMSVCVTEPLSSPSNGSGAHSRMLASHPPDKPLIQPPMTPRPVFPEAGRSLTLFFLLIDSLLSLSSELFRNSGSQGPII